MRPKAGQARNVWSRARVPALTILAALLIGVVAPVVAACGSARAAQQPPSGVPQAFVTPRSKDSADVALAAFNKAFLTVTNGKGHYRMSTEGGRVTFFKQAELIEMTEDAWLRSHDPTYKTLIGVLYKGLGANMAGWLAKTNDDVLWASIMCLRAYGITGNRAYLLQGKKAFDAIYARAISPNLGGGLWNNQGKTSKNTCTNLPASVAAAMLSQSLHDPSYLRKAKHLYAWVRSHLYNSSTGAVYDHVTPKPGGGTTIDRTTWTYNQGILIGAADQLYRITKDRSYYDAALKTLSFTRSSLTADGILKSEVAPGSSLYVSSGGYKGMFVRWATAFINRHHVAGYDAWLRQNADAVRQHVNAAGLTGEAWSQPTGNGQLSAFSCSSAVVLLQWAPAASGGTPRASSVR
jgi:predicted alpha-1,6-mannanase (GH76 family)